MSATRSVTRTLIAGAAGIAALFACAQPALAASSSSTHRVSFQGTSVAVPTAWPVIDLSKNPTACVRFDKHAVYLGSPGPNENCPANVLGRTEAVLIEPATGASSTTKVVENATSAEFDRVAGGVKIVAAYGADRAVATGIMASASAVSTLASSKVAPNVVTPMTATLPYSATNYTGKGFDPCTAPSSATMTAWMASSPYRAIGVYIGGENRGCSQPNLTAAWVAAEVSAGWHFFPIYVGKQASSSSCSDCSKISSAAADGKAEADDAVSEATALGFGPNTPITFDMESYSSSSTTTVLQFLSAWTNELHAVNYDSAVYSSSSSGISDLANHYSSYSMPDVIDDALWNGTADTNDSNVPAADWANHQRIHQYSGGHNETYGGVTINIDQDYLDVQLAAPSTAFDGHQMVDLNGDGLPEIIARNPANNGSLTVYPHVANNFTIAGNAWTTPITFGAGWNVYDKVMFADVNGDGLPDIIARNPTGNGSIVVYPHVPGVTTIAASSWTTAITVGTGWNIYSMITFGDINGDGYPDILAENPTGNGTLVAYPHVPGDTTIAVGMWSPGVTVGTGWNIYDTIGLADINGDGYPEILANNPTGNGTLVAYPHVANDTTIAVGMWSPAITVGSGWNIFDAINTADLNGDGLPEIMARNPAGNGTLVAYPHVAGDTTIAVGMWSPAVTIGTSWNQFGQIM